MDTFIEEIATTARNASEASKHACEAAKHACKAAETAADTSRLATQAIKQIVEHCDLRFDTDLQCIRTDHSESNTEQDQLGTEGATEEPSPEGSPEVSPAHENELGGEAADTVTSLSPGNSVRGYMGLDQTGKCGINESFIRDSQSMPAGAYVCTIDNKECGTTTRLLAAGIKNIVTIGTEVSEHPKEGYSPDGPLGRSDRKLRDKCAELGIENVFTMMSTDALPRILDKFGEGTFGTVFLDYCCTLAHMNTLDVWFAKRMLTEGGKLYITLSERLGGTKRAGRTQEMTRIAESYGLHIVKDVYYNDTQGPMAVYCLAKRLHNGCFPTTALSKFEEFQALAALHKQPRKCTEKRKRETGNPARLLSSRHKRARRAPARLVEHPELMGIKDAPPKGKRFEKGQNVIAKEKPGESPWPGVVVGYSKTDLYRIKWRGFKNYVTLVPEARIQPRPTQCPFPGDKDYVTAWCNKILPQ